MTCFIKDCKNVRRLLPSNSKTTFHRWLIAIGRQDENLTWSPYRYICSDHFRPEDLKVVGGRYTLKKFAMPALCTQESNIHGKERNIQQIATTSSVSQSTEVQRETFLYPQSSPVTSPVKKKKRTVIEESGSESSPLSSPASQSSIVKAESSGSDSSASRKRKRYKLEHSYA